MFNALFSRFDIDGLTVVDLFAGTGAYGLEALSRGAAHATFVDNHRESTGVIERNIDHLGFDAQASIVRTDAVAWAARGERTDVAFCDPPYQWDEWPALLAVLQADWVVAESARPLEQAAGWDVLRTGDYGATVVTFLQHGERA